MALVELSPILKAHWAISGEIPIERNRGIIVYEINVHLQTAETIIKLINALYSINNKSMGNPSILIKEKNVELKTIRYLSILVYSKQANIWAAKNAITK